MKKFRRKLQLVEAIQLTDSNIQEIAKAFGFWDTVQKHLFPGKFYMDAEIGDWFARNSKGSIDLYQNKHFEAFFEEVPE